MPYCPGVPGALRVVAWNAEWAPPDGVRGRRVADTLEALDADVVCLTEGSQGLLPPGGHVATAPPPAERLDVPGARRALLWSRTPLREIDAVGDPELPHEAFVSARTATALGDADLMCVCIPWADAGVARFGGSRRRWEEHELYLEVLERILGRRDADRPLILAGDWNQYLPRIWGPRRLSELLERTLGPLRVATRGEIPGIGAPVIDHVAHSPDLRVRTRYGWGGRTPDGRPMSDHTGVCVELELVA